MSHTDSKTEINTSDTECHGKQCRAKPGQAHSLACIAEHEAVFDRPADAEQTAELGAIEHARNDGGTDAMQGLPDHKQSIMDAMPGMIGAIDQAFLDNSGKKTAFLLVAFFPGGAMHGTNINPPELALQAMRGLVSGLDDLEAGKPDGPAH